MLAIISKTYQQETGVKVLQETLKKGMAGWIHPPSSGQDCGIAVIKDS